VDKGICIMYCDTTLCLSGPGILRRTKGSGTARGSADYV